MMFLGPSLRVALVTTHLAIADVPAAITAARVVRTVRHLAQALDQAVSEGRLDASPWWGSIRTPARVGCSVARSST